ncbi:MAG TPA: hypothetical protein VGC54_01555, partial [Planctomycetota bacterium]
MDSIRLRGLRAGNLRGLDLDLPRGRWTALHGPSGAGKSALLFGVLEPVSRRRFRVLHDPTALPSGDESWLRRLATTVEGLQPVVAWAGEIPRGRGAVAVGTALDLWPYLVAAWSRSGGRRCAACGTEWRPATRAELLARARALEPGTPVHVYSAAGGMGSAELLQAGWTRVRLGEELARLEEAPETLPATAWLLLDRLRWAPAQDARLDEAFAEALRRGRAMRWDAGSRIEKLPAPESCPQCGTGAPARALEDLAELTAAPDLVLAGRDWTAWREAPLVDWRELAAGGTGSSAGARRAGRRLEYLERTGLGHLAAARTLGSLSLGESRRLELVALLAQVRRDQLVLFDEPGMGLHGSERRALAALLRELVQQGNTVLTADPAREFLEAADGWVLLGPGGGPDGGTVVARGTADALPELESWRPPAANSPAEGERLVFPGIRTRFLDIERLELPLGRLVAVAGVSGSGKTTLFEAEVLPRLREGRDFDGAPPPGGVAVLLERALGHAAVSTLATLAGIWSEVRAAFANGEEGRIRGLMGSDLIAKADRGGCPVCHGHGRDRDRLPCPACDGLGLREDLLELRLRQRTLREWLRAPLEKLAKRLPNAGRLRTTVDHLIALGLGGRCLGERGRHLSLGERSRIALARALAGARADRPKLFVLDEPCLGLPSWEARKVVDLLRKLRTQGHGFWVVEHHEVVLRGADWLVELGPGAGPAGGQLLYAGPPAGVRTAGTPTGRWLQARARKPKPPPAPPPWTPPASEALAEDWTRKGRRRLERELARELATRSPLLADMVPAGVGEEGRSEALPPTAWPVTAPRDAALLDVLGLAEALDEALARFGRTVCAACGGAGPWTDLAEACRSDVPGALLAGEWRFTTPLRLPEATRGQEAELLRAAGFRRLVRGGETLRLRDEVVPTAGDEVWLDRFDPRAADAVARVRDLEHQARLLGGGAVHATAAGVPSWSYRTGACRDCGIGTPQAPALREPRLAGHAAAALRAAPLADTLRLCAEEAGSAGPFAAALAVLAGTSLLRRRGADRAAALTSAERRLARLAGFLLFPVDGVMLLHDQPLSGFPESLGRRLAAKLLEPAAGAHRFTDPEGF